MTARHLPRRATRTAGPPRLTCPECHGGGEVGTTQDYFGNWNTARCWCCAGSGDVDQDAYDDHAATAAADLARRTRPVAVNPADDPWAWPGTVRGGWDSEPPF